MCNYVVMKLIITIGLVLRPCKRVYRSLFHNENKVLSNMIFITWSRFKVDTINTSEKMILFTSGSKTYSVNRKITHTSRDLNSPAPFCLYDGYWIKSPHPALIIGKILFSNTVENIIHCSDGKKVPQVSRIWWE